MKVVARVRAERSLVQKGFSKEKSGHHIYFYHEYNGLKTGVSTYISHSRKVKDISGDLLASIRKQLRLNKTKEAVDLLNCPMDRHIYNEILIEKGIFRKNTHTNKVAQKGMKNQELR